MAAGSQGQKSHAALHGIFETSLLCHVLLRRDIQLSQMEGSHVPDNIELGSNLMLPPRDNRDNEAASTLDVLWLSLAFLSSRGPAAMSLQLITQQFQGHLLIQPGRHGR